ncbi:hypothetical protein D3C84_606060 [compost metagenome]
MLLAPRVIRTSPGWALECDVVLFGDVVDSLWVSEREWIDFVCYWPGMPLFIKRAYRDEVMIRKLSERVKTFYEILDECMNKVLGLAA